MKNQNYNPAQEGIDAAIADAQSSRILDKKCNCCGKVHTVIPTTARVMYNDQTYSILGWFWECDCFSTLFVKGEK